MNKYITFFMVLLFAFALIISSCKNKNTSPGGTITGTNSGTGGGSGSGTGGTGGGGTGGGSTGTALANRIGTYTNDNVTMNLTASGSGSDLNVTRNDNLLGLAQIITGSKYHLSDDTNSVNTAFTNGLIPLLGTTIFIFDDTATPPSLTMRSSAVLGLLGSSIILYKQ